MTKLFVTYAAISLVPVLLLGVALAAGFRSEARQRGLAEGRSEAVLVAQTAVEPLLDGRPLSDGLSPDEETALRRLVARAVNRSNVLRLRLRDQSGQVVFSDDGSGFGQQPEDEALEAARGSVEARLTRLNSDSDDSGRIGPQSVEVYLPLEAGQPSRQVGVLEIYLPYAPISADVTSGLHTLYLDLAAGLAALYVAIFAISMSMTRRLRQQLRVNTYLAEHDALTDLPNRAWFHRHARATLAAARPGSRSALAIVDLDRFKEVNDTLGHHNGDHLLAVLAKRLAGHLGSTGSVARLGGDEFGVLLPDVVDPERALWDLRRVVDGEIEVDNLPLSVDSSFGYVLAPDDGNDVDELLQRADVAMYEAKAQHAGVLRYDAAQNHYDPADLALVSELRHAIDENQLLLHYQPKAALSDGRIVSVEALVRWQHPVHGLLSPDRFIPLAEQTDLIDKLTAWVLARALADIASLGPHAARITVAVNASARNLAREDFADLVVGTLARTRVPADRLVVEITETALLTNPGRAAATMRAIQQAGVKISLDDFGAGQTSLGYLATLPIHELKIDRGFVRDMQTNPAHAAIVRSIVDLGHNLGLRVVAEGVDRSDTYAHLRAIGCDVLQGFLLAGGMPLDQLDGWLLSLRQPVTSGV
jgi:diguanylate cyclase (GGDEF)-like protein